MRGGGFSCEVITKNTRETLLSFGVNGKNPYGITTIYKSKKFFAQEKNNFCAPKIDYILFLDSDDVWKENLVEECLKYADGMDVICFDFLRVYDMKVSHIASKVQEETPLLRDKEKVISGEDWIDYVKDVKDNLAKTALTFVWKVFIDFDYLLRIGLRFANQCFLEDHLFGALLLYQAKNIYILPTKLMFYRIRENSETNHTQERKNVGIPSFLEKLCEKFFGDRALTKDVWVSMSCYAMKLQVHDFARKNYDKYGIAIFEERLTGHFRDIYLGFLYRKFDFDRNYYLMICFNLLLSLNENYKEFRPFGNLEKALCVDDEKQKIAIEFLRDLFLYGDSIVTNRNTTIKELEEKIKALEEENSELYLQSLQENQNNNLNVFR